MEQIKEKRGLSSLVLKIIACLLMTLDHIALLFVQRGEGEISTLYYVLRAIGKISFPIFVFLAVEGFYKSKNVKNYILRLATFALGMDAVGYIIGAICSINVADNLLIGNAFTDILMGVLMMYFLNKKGIISILAILPIAFEFLSGINVSSSYGTLFKSDWGSFSIILFLLIFVAKILADKYVDKMDKDIEDASSYVQSDKLKYFKLFASIAIFLTVAIYYLLFRTTTLTFLLPNDFVPLGTYCVLSVIFIAFYSGRRGFKSTKIQYAFYIYYPLHVSILGILSLFFGILSKVR